MIKKKRNFFHVWDFTKKTIVCSWITSILKIPVCERNAFTLGHVAEKIVSVPMQKLLFFSVNFKIGEIQRKLFCLLKFGSISDRKFFFSLVFSKSLSIVILKKTNSARIQNWVNYRLGTKGSLIWSLDNSTQIRVDFTEEIGVNPRQPRKKKQKLVIRIRRYI